MFAEDGGEETEGSSQRLNTGRKQSDGWHSSSRFRKDLESREDLARKAGERTLRKLGSVKPKSCEVPVVFSTEMAQSFSAMNLCYRVNWEADIMTMKG